MDYNCKRFYDADAAAVIEETTFERSGKAI